jgi:hypothetical protein
LDVPSFEEKYDRVTSTDADGIPEDSPSSGYTDDEIAHMSDGMADETSSLQTEEVQKNQRAQPDSDSSVEVQSDMAPDSDGASYARTEAVEQDGDDKEQVVPYHLMEMIRRRMEDIKGASSDDDVISKDKSSNVAIHADAEVARQSAGVLDESSTLHTERVLKKQTREPDSKSFVEVQSGLMDPESDMALYGDSGKQLLDAAGASPQAEDDDMLRKTADLDSSSMVSEDMFTKESAYSDEEVAKDNMPDGSSTNSVEKSSSLTQVGTEYVDPESDMALYGGATVESKLNGIAESLAQKDATSIVPGASDGSSFAEVGTENVDPESDMALYGGGIVESKIDVIAESLVQKNASDIAPAASNASSFAQVDTDSVDPESDMALYGVHAGRQHGRLESLPQQRQSEGKLEEEGASFSQMHVTETDSVDAESDVALYGAGQNAYEGESYLEMAKATVQSELSKAATFKLELKELIKNVTHVRTQDESRFPRRNGTSVVRRGYNSTENVPNRRDSGQSSNESSSNAGSDLEVERGNQSNHSKISAGTGTLNNSVSDASAFIQMKSEKKPDPITADEIPQSWEPHDRTNPASMEYSHEYRESVEDEQELHGIFSLDL